ncbi:hypothetical protein KGA65_19970 [Ideonella sp. B7]|uniref:hypothetical protein n=1 Tax=Ideonella benzenivorans TaxID=2831643 RepID=UPI001CED8D4E|nr:hypothetical protein [Ideonella benzenivorans]MCA6218827.1 hypothetical protein [Ideonella benzenivorans]
MSKALGTRILRALTSLVATGSSRKVANLAADLQGLGVSGLRGPRPKTEFEIVFTSNPDFLELHEHHAGIDIPLMSTPGLFLSFEGEMKTIRHLEDIADLPAVHRWTSRRSRGLRDGDEDVWLRDWLEGLMEDYPPVDSAVRQAVIRSIDDQLLADIEEDIAREIDEIVESRRYAAG